MTSHLMQIKNAYEAFSSYKSKAMNSAVHDYFNVFSKNEADIKGLLSKDLKDASVLIVGCGYLYPDVLLFSNQVKEVIGIDVIDCFWRDGFLKLFISNLEKEGSLKEKSKGIVKTLKNRLGIKRAYYSCLEKNAQRRLSHENVSLYSYDGLHIPFEDGRFDVVMSNAALEHIMKLDFVIKEMARVTSSRGINYHLYHNYYSFSGNHQPYYMNNKYPWGHLRGLIKTNPTHLNRVKISELESYFQRYFSRVRYFCVSQDHSKLGVDDGFCWEEEELFENYRRVLEKQYSEELLLSRAFLIVGEQKRKSF